MLHRQVERIVLVINSPDALAPRAKWDPRDRPPRLGDIDDNLASYFGVFIDRPNIRQSDYRWNQVFNTSDFVRLAIALQDAQAVGKMAAATIQLTTLPNPHFNIPGGMTSMISVLYLS